MEGSSLGWSRSYEGTSFDGALPRLVEPEILLPSQFHNRFRGGLLEGERKLMLAILEDAVACFQKHAGDNRPRAVRAFEETEQWFMDTEDAWVFSFESICHILQIHPGYFRRNLSLWKARMLAKTAEERAQMGRVRLRAARRHKILPVVPRRRNKPSKQGDARSA